MLLTITRGLSTKIKTETDDLSSVVCHSCKKTGHLSKNCQERKNRIFSWKCTTCNGHSFNTGCKDGDCQTKTLKKAADYLFFQTPVIKQNYDKAKQKQLDSANPAWEMINQHVYTQKKIQRRANGLSRLKRPKAKDDEVYKVNMPKIFEMKAIMIAANSSSQGLDGFAVAFEKQLLDYANGGHLHYAEWYSKKGAMMLSKDKFEKDTIMPD